MKISNALHLIIMAAFLLLLSGTSASGQIVVGPPEMSMPFLETFDDDPLGSAIPTIEGTPWGHMGWPATVEVDGTGHDYRVTGGPGEYNVTSVTITNGLGKNCTVSVEFELQSITTVPLGNPGDSGYDPSLYNIVTLSGIGFNLSYHPYNQQEPAKHQRLSFFDGTSTNISAGALAPVLGLTYHMWITGEYATPGDSNSDFMLTAGLTDGNTTLTLDWTGSGPSQNYAVGMSASAGNNSNSYGTMAVDFDNFSIVPEPATLGLLLLGGLVMLRRKRST